jgi:hypothetical protein
MPLLWRTNQLQLQSYSHGIGGLGLAADEPDGGTYRDWCGQLLVLRVDGHFPLPEGQRGGSGCHHADAHPISGSVASVWRCQVHARAQ